MLDFDFSFLRSKVERSRDKEERSDISFRSLEARHYLDRDPSSKREVRIESEGDASDRETEIVRERMLRKEKLERALFIRNTSCSLSGWGTH